MGSTKPHTALGLLTLVEDGKVALSQELQEWIPEAKGTALAGLTLRVLATHVSGLPPWKPLFKAGLANPEAKGDHAILPDAHARILAEILATPLNHPTGTKYAYSDLGYMVPVG